MPITTFFEGGGVKRILTGLAATALIVGSSITGHSAVNAASNLIINPGFETGTGNTATSWTNDKWGTQSATFTVPTTGAHSGT